MQDDAMTNIQSPFSGDHEEFFSYIERDARRYDKAFVEEAEAKRV